MIHKSEDLLKIRTKVPRGFGQGIINGSVYRCILLTFFRFVEKGFFVVKKGERIMKKNSMKSFIAVGIFAILVVVLGLVYNNFKPKTVEGSKKITVEVIIPEEETKEFTLHTDAEYLRQALDEEKLIEGSESEYGFFITGVNGRVADSTKEEWWCITKDGEEVYTGVNETPIQDGDNYELTLKVGF